MRGLSPSRKSKPGRSNSSGKRNVTPEQEANIFCSDIVGMDFILSEFQEVTDHKKVEKLVIEDWIAGEHWRMSRNISRVTEQLLFANDRVWQSICFMDSVDLDVFSSWQEKKHEMMSDYEERGVVSQCHLSEVLVWKVHVYISEGTSVEELKMFFKAAKNDEDIASASIRCSTGADIASAEELGSYIEWDISGNDGSVRSSITVVLKCDLSETRGEENKEYQLLLNCCIFALKKNRKSTKGRPQLVTSQSYRLEKRPSGDKRRTLSSSWDNDLSALDSATPKRGSRRSGLDASSLGLLANIKTHHHEKREGVSPTKTKQGLGGMLSELPSSKNYKRQQKKRNPNSSSRSVPAITTHTEGRESPAKGLDDMLAELPSDLLDDLFADLPSSKSSKKQQKKAMGLDNMLSDLPSTRTYKKQQKKHNPSSSSRSVPAMGLGEMLSELPTTKHCKKHQKNPNPNSSSRSVPAVPTQGRPSSSSGRSIGSSDSNHSCPSTGDSSGSDSGGPAAQRGSRPKLTRQLSPQPIRRPKKELTLELDKDHTPMLQRSPSKRSVKKSSSARTPRKQLTLELDASKSSSPKRGIKKASSDRIPRSRGVQRTVSCSAMRSSKESALEMIMRKEVAARSSSKLDRSESMSSKSGCWWREMVESVPPAA